MVNAFGSSTSDARRTSVLEACLRKLDNFIVSEKDVLELANWNAKAPKQVEVPFMPGRVVLQDFTGVPAVVDLAALRSAIIEFGSNCFAHVSAMVAVDDRQLVGIEGIEDVVPQSARFPVARTAHAAS